MSPDALPAAATMPPWRYEQATGRLWHGSVLVGVGYSGRDEAKNQPDLDGLRNRGPIPRGFWRMGPPIHSTAHGPFCIPLAPCEGTETHGRSGFLVHGDSREHPGCASEGCIILPHEVREELWGSGQRVLEVLPHVEVEALIA